jgi:tetrahydromethanopterin S-methyltransferase subunit E
METFWTLLAKSVIVSGFIVVVCMSTLAYLAIIGKPIPEVLVNITLTVVGFYFGSKVGATEANANRDKVGT